jgi:hypothetical protein
LKSAIRKRLIYIREPKIAVNIDVKIPIAKVIAKPLIGPVPKPNKTKATSDIP